MARVRHGLDLGLYLRDVMLKLASGWPQSRLDEFLPHRWREPVTNCRPLAFLVGSRYDRPSYGGA